MKVCKMGLESIWIDWAVGSVRLCSWANYRLGNLQEHSIEELWNGERAQKFRESMLDGSYCYCDRKKCRYMANHKLDSIMVEYEVPKYPKWCSLSYETACNYVCKFCRKEKYIPEADEKEKIAVVEREVAKFIDQLETLSSNGVGELFCSPAILKTLGEIENEQMKIRLESNGSLFNEKNWQKIKNLGQHDLMVAITVHSFREDTYQFLSGTSLSIDNIIHNLEFISGLRKKQIINEFQLATVICERNFREMPEFVKRCLEFEPDSIRLRFFEPYGVQPAAIEWFYDIRNPHHPYYEEFVEVMKDPIFSHPKVWKWQGDTLSDFEEHPYFEEQRKVKILSQLMIMENVKGRLEAYLKEHQIQKFALYGNGYVGQAFAVLLDQNKIEFDVIFDTYTKMPNCFREHKVLQPSKETINKYDMLIITSVAYGQIEKTLQHLEYDGGIISLEKLIENLNCLANTN